MKEAKILLVIKNCSMELAEKIQKVIVEHNRNERIKYAASVTYEKRD